jgi:hypothetical protein
MNGTLGFPPICSLLAWLFPFVVEPQVVFSPLRYSCPIVFHSARRDLPSRIFS